MRIVKEDIEQVAKDLGITLTPLQIGEIMIMYRQQSSNDLWVHIVEDLIYNVTRN